jgi:hypothetical protein
MDALHELGGREDGPEDRAAAVEQHCQRMLGEQYRAARAVAKEENTGNYGIMGDYTHADFISNVRRDAPLLVDFVSGLVTTDARLTSGGCNLTSDLNEECDAAPASASASDSASASTTPAPHPQPQHQPASLQADRKRDASIATILAILLATSKPDFQWEYGSALAFAMKSLTHSAKAVDICAAIFPGTPSNEIFQRSLSHFYTQRNS